MRFSRFLISVVTLILVAPVSAAPSRSPVSPPVEIELSHLLDEERAERLAPLVEHFNSQNKNIQVKLTRRVEGGAPKQINLVTRQEYARFLTKQAKFKPLYEVMREAKEPFDVNSFSPELRDSLTDAKGRMFALPLAFSTPILFINKAAFRKAGLNPESPPKTWAEMQEAAGKLADSGSHCPYTTSRPASVFIDNLSAWDAAEVSNTKGLLTFNGLAQIKHIAMMATWYKSKYFSYFGRGDEADRRFANGECGMLTSSSSLFPSLMESRLVEVGVSSFPYHDDVQGAPQNTLADGASLWVANGLKPAETKAVAKFVSYVLSPEIQINLTLAGGFLPMTPVARTAAGSKLMKSDLAGLQVAYAQLKGKASSPTVRVAQIEPINAIVEEELEAVWSNKKPAKEALDTAVLRGNAVLRAAAPVSGAKKKR